MSARIHLRSAWRFFTLFRLFGVPVQFHTTWLLFPCGLVLWGGYECALWKGMLLGLAFLALFLGSILTHEFAHILAARRYGCETRRVSVIPFACIAELESIPLGLGELCVAGAGPLASLLLGALIWGAGLVIGVPHDDLFGSPAQAVLLAFAFINFGLAFFNLFPCFPMDGGRILRSSLAILLGWLFPRRGASTLLLATRIAVRYVARPLAVGIMLLTVLYTHLWHHVLIFGFLILAGEAELWCLREAMGPLSMPRELHFLPVTGQLFPRRGFRKSRRPFRPAAGSLGLRIASQTGGGGGFGPPRLAFT